MTLYKETSSHKKLEENGYQPAWSIEADDGKFCLVGLKGQDFVKPTSCSLTDD